MAVNEVSVYMNRGDGGTSYTNNSNTQKIGISKSWYVLDETLKDMFADNNGFPKYFKMADLGCSSGPNTFSAISHIIEKIEEICEEKNCSQSTPEFEVFLNDLPENDFNNLFKMLPNFYKKLNKRTKCFVSALPGSFYDRLFPTKTLNFVHSSFSLMWLSQVPQGMESNKENIHLGLTSPPEVFEAYTRQYHKDFTTFLSSRGQEMVPGGRMVLTLCGRSVEDPSMKDDCGHFTLLGNTLLDMVKEGLIKEGDLHSYNLPIYTPCKQEVEGIISVEGSFNLDKLDEFLVPWDVLVERDTSSDLYKAGELFSGFVRAFTEPILAPHFGSLIMDELYERYGQKLGEHLSREVPAFFNMVLCLSKK